MKIEQFPTVRYEAGCPDCHWWFTDLNRKEVETRASAHEREHKVEREPHGTDTPGGSRP